MIRTCEKCNLIVDHSAPFEVREANKICCCGSVALPKIEKVREANALAQTPASLEDKVLVTDEAGNQYHMIVVAVTNLQSKLYACLLPEDYQEQSENSDVVGTFVKLVGDQIMDIDNDEEFELVRDHFLAKFEADMTNG